MPTVCIAFQVPELTEAKQRLCAECGLSHCCSIARARAPAGGQTQTGIIQKGGPKYPGDG